MEESFEAPENEKSSAAPEFIQYQEEDGVARITLVPPTASNAMNITMLEEIGSVLEIIDMNPEIKILLFQGDDKAFSSGLDIAEHTEVRFSHGICPECYEKIIKPQLGKSSQHRTVLDKAN